MMENIAQLNLQTVLLYAQCVAVLGNDHPKMTCFCEAILVGEGGYCRRHQRRLGKDSVKWVGY
jgi:hypothetical protein